MHKESESKKTQKVSTTQKLITHSRFNGVWLDPLQCMEGHGVYTYPDGSEYRGNFHRGHFHGKGTLHLASPYDFAFKGTFFNGKLVEIEDMWFDDGLCVTANINGWNMDFSSWKYCCKDDRRYAEEQRDGLQAIGPFSMLTSERPPRELEKDYYDVEEGIYNLLSGLITKRPSPFPSIEFVSCRENMEWILKNCRHGPLVKMNIPSHVCHKIMRNNLNSELEIAEDIPSCNNDQDKNIKNYFSKLYHIHTKDVKGGNKIIEVSEDSIGSRLANSSSTCGSFSTASLDIDVQEILFLAEDYGNCSLGRNLSQETPILIKEHPEI